MKRLLPALLLGLLPVRAAEDPAPPDLLRFTNGNRLDGHFGGLKPGPTLLWQRDDVAAPVEFKTSQLRQVVLRGGHAAKPFTDLSSIGLINGDRIPGTITSLNDHEVTIDTVFAGPMIVRRDNVSLLAPNPLGGRLLYSGPFSGEGWTQSAPQEDRSGLTLPPTNEKKDDDDVPKGPAWSYSGGSWYSRQGQSALIRNVGLTDRSVVRFHLAWKSRLAIAVAFQADLKEAPKPKNAEEGKEAKAPGRMGMGMDVGGSTSYPKLFGNAYVMNLYPNYVILYRSGYDADGKPYVDRIQAGGTNIRLAEAGEADVELRCNRLTGEISLFLNGEFALQWTEPTGAGKNGYAGQGGALGFMVQSSGTPVRVSDVVAAEWNGMPDAARSLQADDQDIVLLTNGTDRFSGEVSGLAEGKLQLKGRYGNFDFPISEVSEVRFARNHQAKKAAEPSEAVFVRFHPFGRVSGAPSDGPAGTLSLTTPLSGKINLNLDYAVMVDFKNSTSFLDDWDPQY